MKFGSNVPVGKLKSNYATLLEAFRLLAPQALHNGVLVENASRF